MASNASQQKRHCEAIPGGKHADKTKSGPKSHPKETLRGSDSLETSSKHLFSGEVTAEQPRGGADTNMAAPDQQNLRSEFFYFGKLIADSISDIKSSITAGFDELKQSVTDKPYYEYEDGTESDAFYMHYEDEYVDGDDEPLKTNACENKTDDKIERLLNTCEGDRQSTPSTSHGDKFLVTIHDQIKTKVVKPQKSWRTLKSLAKLLTRLDPGTTTHSQGVRVDFHIKVAIPDEHDTGHTGVDHISLF
ncbi:uncharacterized protein LOC125377439 [Haliotis rufescens]|uniref:uncharacterized protein LOC125377439 n=1 Tax=Haliotis rufescens TaxID=6454 RepID=UPI00201F3963|nr:uncharacterized protein LOC125377439 [Haliotis rufescens]